MSKAARYRKKLSRAGVVRGNYRHKRTSGVFMNRGTDVSTPFGIHYKYRLRKDPNASKLLWKATEKASRLKYKTVWRNQIDRPFTAGGKTKEYESTLRIKVDAKKVSLSGLYYVTKNK